MKIYKVKFASGRKSEYFGSLAAIYEMFTPADIGVGLRRLWTLKVSSENPYTNKLCKITAHRLHRKPKQGGNENE